MCLGAWAVPWLSPAPSCWGSPVLLLSVQMQCPACLLSTSGTLASPTKLLPNTPFIVLNQSLPLQPRRTFHRRTFHRRLPLHSLRRNPTFGMFLSFYKRLPVFTGLTVQEHTQSGQECKSRLRYTRLRPDKQLS